MGDKSRSLGFSPGTNFWSPLKSPVFFKGMGPSRNARATFCPSRQECSGYLLSSVSGMLGRMVGLLRKQCCGCGTFLIVVPGPGGRLRHT